MIHAQLLGLDQLKQVKRLKVIPSFFLAHVYPVSYTHLKSITTAIGMGVSEEAGGIVTLTVMSIVLTGVLGNMAGEAILRLARVHHPVAKGLALGTSAHAVGTAKALELGEIEGAMSSLSIAVAGLMTCLLYTSSGRRREGPWISWILWMWPTGIPERWSTRILIKDVWNRAYWKNRNSAWIN